MQPFCIYIKIHFMQKFQNLSNAAFLLIDMQYDFMEGGALEVAQANDLIKPINNLLALNWKTVIASKDWHPHNHVSFAFNHHNHSPFELTTLPNGRSQMLWPVHCVQDTLGSKIHSDIDVSKIKATVLKGRSPHVDSYSAFFDNDHIEKTALDEVLRQHEVNTIFVAGLAADYCVKFTALDGRQLGYEVYYVLDATKFVSELNRTQTLSDLKAAGVKIISSTEISS